ncbi:serine/threonine protein phosphatase 2A regulatory subunit B' beta isoform-like protein [Carex littledalei]|uniref:Serine/threonine protein phosphatase 2A regulatory subunit B' beta isoform-like protein n=1 Tax=Carex littledalei TaxID=544730 RepID=A0A833QMF5_9POAL|nr:serine/threonine protein phosphatase 2A regulatory subunit B' beta isoform-like protein [Carex littledalei]
MELVKKEMQLAEVVLQEVLRYWPLTNCQKEVLIIGELDELAMVLEPVPEQFDKLAKCLTSYNSQVSLCLDAYVLLAALRLGIGKLVVMF